MALSGALGLAGLVRFFSYQTNPSKPVLFDLGPVDKVATDAITLVPNAQSAILPVEGGFQALSLVCPHLGCLVDAKKDRFVCPCHGSEFNLDGSLKKGPSDRALTSLPLEITEEGHLLLDTSES